MTTKPISTNWELMRAVNAFLEQDNKEPKPITREALAPIVTYIKKTVTPRVADSLGMDAVVLLSTKAMGRFTGEASFDLLSLRTLFKTETGAHILQPPKRVNNGKSIELDNVISERGLFTVISSGERVNGVREGVWRDEGVHGRGLRFFQKGKEISADDYFNSEAGRRFLWRQVPDYSQHGFEVPPSQQSVKVKAIKFNEETQDYDVFVTKLDGRQPIRVTVGTGDDNFALSRGY